MKTIIENYLLNIIYSREISIDEKIKQLDNFFELFDGKDIDNIRMPFKSELINSDTLIREAYAKEMGARFDGVDKISEQILEILEHEEKEKQFKNFLKENSVNKNFQEEYLMIDLTKGDCPFWQKETEKQFEKVIKNILSKNKPKKNFFQKIKNFLGKKIPGPADCLLGGFVISMLVFTIIIHIITLWK